MSVTRIRSAPPIDVSWQAGAACLGASIDLFMGPEDERVRERSRREALALVLCAACPVRRACLEHALAVPELHGVWGGTTPGERLATARTAPVEASA